MSRTVAILGTLDTKGHEVKYLRDEIKKKGKNTLVIDDGMLDPPLAIEPDITQETVAQAADSSFEVVRTLGRGDAEEIMMRGVAKVVKDLYADGRFDGIIAVGGSDGSVLASSGMRQLPIGVPKLIVTPVAQGLIPFGNFIGTNDIMMMHSVVDILGINEISKKVFDVAIAGIVGMVDAHVSPELTKCENLVAMTMVGNTTPTGMRAKSILEERGYEVVVFHANGTGGRAMEEFIDKGAFAAVLDLTMKEITGELIGDDCKGGPDRLEAAGRKGIPQLVVPGCIDHLSLGPYDRLSEEHKRRKHYYFNPTVTMVKLIREEMVTMGKAMAEKLNRATGPTAVAIPLRGFCMYCHPGEPLHDPEVDMAFVRALKERIRPEIKVTEVDAHINDSVFAEIIARMLIEMMEGTSMATA